MSGIHGRVSYQSVYRCIIDRLGFNRSHKLVNDYLMEPPTNP